ncbi:hypothetical protein ACIPRL_31905 [Streptomyces sp. NPDC090085]|uniref:hypothetical protein n=1 Tax=Streptomyces sp. NPDC090085 TaxID=3365943 RepID=UPI00380FA146
MGAGWCRGGLRGTADGLCGLRGVRRGRRGDRPRTRFHAAAGGGRSAVRGSGGRGPPGRARAGPGLNSWFGTLEADTPYWIRAWQLVPEGADLSRARLCEARPAAGTENCVPVGEVRSGDAALPGAG